MKIRAATPADAAAVCEVYNPYVLGTTISFEEDALTPEQMARRMADTMQHFPWLLAEIEGQVVGYAYAGVWKTRPAYRHCAEVSIYVREGHAGRGIGHALYTALLQALQPLNLHVLLACIALPNDASVRLHEAFGFTQAGHFSEVGRKFDQWLDVGYWVKPLQPTTALAATPMPDADETLATLRDLEPLIYVANDGQQPRAHFERLLANEFWEVGASGRVYTREVVLDTLQARQQSPYAEAWQASDHRAQRLAPDLVLLTYTLQQPTRLTRRATLWRHTAPGWQMVYHQGTVVQDT